MYAIFQWNLAKARHEIIESIHCWLIFTNTWANSVDSTHERSLQWDDWMTKNPSTAQLKIDFYTFPRTSDFYIYIEIWNKILRIWLNPLYLGWNG